MIRLQDPELRPTDDRSAWQASWTDDERLLAHCPPGYRQSLVHISQIKRVLQWNLPPELRLRFLETLHKFVHDHLSLEAMQTVAPACDTAMAMLDEMRSLNIRDKSNLMMKWNVIAAFVNLNPSIIEAIKLFGYPLTKERAA